MKRVAFLLAVCLSFAILASFVFLFLHSPDAASDEELWLRNDGAWEKIVRVHRGRDYICYGFRCATNGIVTRHFPHQEATNILWRVDYDFYNRHSGNNIVAERKTYSWYFYGLERVYPAPEPMAWSNDVATVAWKTNHLAEVCAKDNGNQRYDYTAFTVVRTNVLDVTPQPKIGIGDLPCRLGVPSPISVELPYVDFLDKLPLNYPQTYIRVKIDFDGYILLRFEEEEDRLIIKRLLPEQLPYERPVRNIRVRLDDLLNGV